MHILTTRKIEDNLHMSPAHCSNNGLAIHPPQLLVLQVKWFFNLVTNSCSSCCGCWNIIIIIIIIILERKRMRIFVSPDITNTYHCRPWFFATKRRDFGFGIKEDNHSINFNQLCSRTVKRIEFIDSLRFFCFLFFGSSYEFSARLG